ncbi:hypothetical protein HDU98_007812, partial [Podochytrium sp. JEL0797]
MRRVLTFVVLFVFYAAFFRFGPVFSFAFKVFGIDPPPAARVVGFAAPGFEKLRSLLQQGFSEGDDLGSQFAAYVDGSLVADIAGGYTDRTSFTTPYSTNTLQQVFSCSKFVTSSVFLHLVDTKRLSLDDLVSSYWPEFAAGNKSHVTVGQLLQHRAGVAFLDPQRVPSLDEMLDLDALATKIAGQPHNFNGEQVGAYHAVTRGWFLNEICRRATGKSVREIMYSEILPKLNDGRFTENFGIPDKKGNLPFEFHYGIPDSPESLSDSVRSRIAPLDSSPLVWRIVHILTPTWLLEMFGQGHVPSAFVKAFVLKGTLQNKVLFGSGPEFTTTTEFPWSYNDPTSRRSQSPSFNGLTNARSLARLAELIRRSSDPSATGFVSASTFNASFASLPTSVDRVIGVEISFTRIGTGVFTKGFGRGTKWETGSGSAWYGWSGAGGSIVLFNLELGVSLAYTMNFSHLQSVGDQRSWRLIKEIVRVVEEGRRKGKL